MNFSFADETRAALSKARDAALDFHHGHVGTEHIALGVLRDPKVERILGRLNTEPSRLRDTIRRRLPEGDAILVKGELPYTARAKKVLELAIQAARDLRDDTVFPIHVLLGVLREEKGEGARVLNEFDITEDRLNRLRDEARGNSVLRVRIDDASDVSIYEQIVAQVTEAIATGVVQEGERLPTVRRLADELEIAPGTVAKAYAEMERQGLVTTDGARGTRVAERKKASPHAELLPTLAGLMRPVAVAAFHLGATAEDLRKALDEAVVGIFGTGGKSA